VFAPAIALHSLATWWAAAVPASALIVAVGLTTLLFVSFRLWDDLEDVDRDRVFSPDRVLVTANRLWFHLLHAVLLIVSAMLFAQEADGLPIFLAMMAAAWVCYRTLRPWLSDAQWRFGILLMKYPLFTLLVVKAIGGEASARLAIAALSSYAAACGYEAWHHRPRADLGVAK
jgi:hypothetical protein